MAFPLTYSDDNKVVVGVDIGGTHVTASQVDLATQTILPETQVRMQLNSRLSAEEVVRALALAIEAAYTSVPVAEVRIGVAMPGPFDYANGISHIKDQNKFDALYGLSLKELLAQKLGLRPEQILFMNDAACFLLGEAFGGAAIGYSHVIGLTLGTGLGTCRYSQEEAEDAALWDTPFREGIAEEYLVTRWFVKRYLELTGEEVAGAKEVFDRSEKEPEAKQVVEEYGENLAEFLAYFIELDKPEAVVIGGNISKSADLFLPITEKSLAAKGIELPLLQAKLGEEAALLGAAALWLPKPVTN